MATKEQIKAYLELIVAVGDCIRDLREIPSGHLYARLMGSLNLETYTNVIGQLKKAQLVKEDNSHLLTWIGPVK